MKSPTSMMTQHPDSASRYVSVQQEVAEAADALTPPPAGLGLDEVMIDFEGKMTPYHQTTGVAQALIDRGITPGVDVWITPRVSSATEETAFRQLMALMSIIEADYDISKTSEAGAIREVVLPMVRQADDIASTRRRISDVFDLARKEFGLKKEPASLQLIPLVEDVRTMLKFGQLYREYLAEASDPPSERLRFMVGRSDSAMVSGLIASALATRIMLSQAAKLGEERGLGIMPIFGGGLLPFRGHVTLENLGLLIESFPGLRTVTVQSAIRYDHEPDSPSKMAEILATELPKSETRQLDGQEEIFLTSAVGIAEREYAAVFEKIIPTVATLSDVLPQQRDRLTRRSYGRGSPGGAKDVPRAIAFTGTLYSIGLPPEFLGLGGLLKAIADGLGSQAPSRLMADYPGLRADLTFARRYLDLDVAGSFFPGPLVSEIRKDLSEAETLLDLGVLGFTDSTYSTMLKTVDPLLRNVAEGADLTPEDGQLMSTCLTRLGKLRGSLG